MHWIDFHVLHGIPTALVRFPYPCMEIHPIALFLLDAAVPGQCDNASSQAGQHTVEKSQTSAVNVKFDPLLQTL